MSSRNTGMAHPDLVHFTDALIKELHQRGLMRCCPDCINWDPSKEQCLNWMVRPPAQIIAKGCDEFDPDIPF